MLECPLCKSISISLYSQAMKREFQQCLNCSLVFVTAKYHLSDAQEKKQYDFHNNDPNDKGYRDFLSKLAIPLNAKLQKNSKGLDFGSGPGPTISLIMEEFGHEVALYDKFYEPNELVFKRKYDFITSTEVFEHLNNPSEVISKLLDCLNSGGFLGVMTKFLLPQDEFNDWHYIRDSTHITFYSKKTFSWIADYYKLTIEYISDGVVIFKK